MATISLDSGDHSHPPIQRKALLGFLTLGHVGIHWYKQLFPVILPYIKADHPRSKHNVKRRENGNRA